MFADWLPTDTSACGPCGTEQLPVLGRDFSGLAVALRGKAFATAEPQRWALGAVRCPTADEARSERVEALSGKYEMTP